MAKEITREEAWALLTEYNKEPFHLKHGETVEGVMRWYAEKLGYGDEVDFWGIVGLLHDLDFEQFPEQHCIKSQEIMRERGLSERLIHATASHGYLLTVDIAPEHEMELKSVKKKYKALNFAAGCSREVIQRGADMLGWTLDDLISDTILAMRTLEKPQAE